MQGVWNKGMYCPCSPPADAPLAAQNRKGSGYPWAVWDPLDLPLRENDEFRRVAAQVAKKGATSQQRSKYGVKGLSILSRLSSVDFPRSFPPDSMHLWFENVIPDLVKHWRGKYRVDLPVASDKGDESDADVELSEEDRPDPQSGDEPPTKKRRTRHNAKGKATKKKKAIKAKEPKVVVTDDPYNIKLRDWERTSRDIAASAATFPSLFGPLLRNFLEHIHEMTASEWQLFTLLIGPVYLKGLLPDEDYEEFISLVEAIHLSCDYTLTEEDFQEMEERILRFSQYYEERYYRLEWDRLKACLPVFHQVLHVHQALRWAGPMYVYSQWAMERFCGTLATSAKSRVATNRNLSINLTMMEQKNCLIYVIGNDNICLGSEDEDSDGNIQLARFLGKRLRNSRPPDRIEKSDKDFLLFCGPSNPRALTTYERTCLKAFLLNETNGDMWGRNNADLEAHADSFDIPAYCRIFRSASYNTILRGDSYPFKSTSSTARRSNQSRSTSFVRYEAYQRRGGNESRFGEVLFFFSIDLPEESVLLPKVGRIGQQVQEKERGPIRQKHPHELLLAYIQWFPVARDGRLLYRDGRGVKEVILAANIHELVGLLLKEKREYVVRRNTAFF